MKAYLAVSSLLVSSVTLFFFVAVLLKGLRKKKNLTFCIFAFSVFVWSLGHMYWQLSDSEESAIFWIRVLVMGSSMIPYAYLHFVTSFVGRPMPKLVFIGYAIAVSLCIFAWTPYIFIGVENRMAFEFWPIAGPLFPIYFGGFVIVVLFCFVLLVAQYKRASLKIRNQNKYLIIGTAIGFFGGGTNFPLWLNIPIPPILHGLSILYILGIGYSVLKYRLLDFNEMVIRILGILSLSVFFGAIISVVFGFLMTHAYPSFYPSGSMFWWAVFSGLSFIFLASSPQISRYFDEIVEAKLSAARFAYRNELRKLSDEWISDVHSETAVQGIIEGIQNIMRLDYTAIYIRKGMEASYSCVAAKGSRPRIDQLDAITLDPVISLLFGRRHAFFLDEEVDRSSVSRSSIDALCCQYTIFSPNDVLVPVLAHDSFYGFLILGSSSRHGAFAEVDMLILENLCSQYALALKSREVERMSNQVEGLVSLGTMAAGLSHELRNPLVSVKTLSGLLSKGSSDFLRLTPEFSKTIQRDIKRISGIVDGVSAFAQNSNRPMAHVVVADVIGEAKASLEEQLNQNKINLSLVVEGDVPCALGNFEQLVQVFFNILENAINAISEWKDRPEEGKIFITISAQGMEPLKRDKWVEIQIKDNGPGMSEDFKSSIFDPFFTSRDTGARPDASGTGLGLAIVNKIIQHHKGRIIADSKLLEGTVFRISIPST